VLALNPTPREEFVYAIVPLPPLNVQIPARLWQEHGMAFGRSAPRDGKPRERKPKKPLTAESLRWFALRYVERYATTRAKLRDYLQGKLRERGWSGEGEAPIDETVECFAELGYVDDRAFGEARARSLERRGYGPRRVAQTLAAAGVEQELREEIGDGFVARDAAIAYARRRRIGPFGPPVDDPALRQKQFAAMVRAGHDFDLTRRVLDARSENDLFDD
jgi:regulatory protein